MGEVDNPRGGGLGWHRALLAETANNGELYNGYNTPTWNLIGNTTANMNDNVDCFLSGLAAIGVPPEMISVEPTLPPQFSARIKYWIQLSKMLGGCTPYARSPTRMRKGRMSGRGGFTGLTGLTGAVT